MKIKSSLSPLLAALLLAACSSGPIHMAKIDSTVQLYASAIRFGEFEKAQEFVDPTKRSRPDLAWLRNVHVSSYDIIHRKENLGGHIYEITVEIHYFIESEGVEKSLTDRQLWRYDVEQQRMMLETGLPEFR